MEWDWKISLYFEIQFKNVPFMRRRRLYSLKYTFYNASSIKCRLLSNILQMRNLSVAHLYFTGFAVNEFVKKPGS